MLQTMSLLHFAGHVGTTFRVNAAPHSLELKLVEATDLGSTPRQEQFSLVFEGPSNLLLNQAIYRLEHAELGDLDLFLVPIGRHGEGFTYQAVFNRLVKG